MSKVLFYYYCRYPEDYAAGRGTAKIKKN